MDVCSVEKIIANVEGVIVIDLKNRLRFHLDDYHVENSTIFGRDKAGNVAISIEEIATIKY